VKPSYALVASKRRVSQQLQEVNWDLSEPAKASRRIAQRARKKARKEAGKTEQFRALYDKERYLKGANPFAVVALRIG
jgi:hypothetical protein